MRPDLVKGRSQFYKDLATPFYAANRTGAKESHGILDQFWIWKMQACHKNAHESIKAFFETDFGEDLQKIEILPWYVWRRRSESSGQERGGKSARLIRDGKETYHTGAPHGISATHQARVNADLLTFPGYQTW
jgi:non-heme chloroperoxidase